MHHMTMVLSYHACAHVIGIEHVLLMVLPVDTFYYVFELFTNLQLLYVVP